MLEAIGDNDIGTARPMVVNERSVIGNHATHLGGLVGSAIPTEGVFGLPAWAGSLRPADHAGS